MSSYLNNMNSFRRSPATPSGVVGRGHAGSTIARVMEEAAEHQGYYGRPDLWKDAEAMQQDLLSKKDAYTQSDAARLEAEKALTDTRNALAFLHQRAEQARKTGAGSGTLTGLQERYNSLYKKFRTQRLSYAAAYDQYSRDVASFNQSLEAYNAYSKKNEQMYEAWKSRIRDSETVRKEMARLDLDLKYGDVAPDDYERKKKLLQEEYDWGMHYKYADLMQADDFAEKSKYVSTYRGGEQFNAMAGIYTDNGFDDIDYDYINRNETAVDRQGLSDVQSNEALMGLDNSERGQMTDEEIGIFNYVYVTQGRDAAFAYIDYLTSDLNARQRAADEQQWAKYAEEKPVAMSLLSAAMSPLKGLSYVGQAADLIGDGKIDQNAGYNKYSYLNSAVREQVSKDIKGSIDSEFWGQAGSFGYQTAMSMADFLTTALVSGGNSALAMTIMGSGAAADTVIDAKDRGLSDGQAFTLGTIAGVAEAVTEKLSLDTLLDKTSLGKNAAGYVLKNVLAEGSEEGASTLINTMADILVSKDKSQWQTSVDAYKADGKTEGQAFGLALRDQALALGLDVLGGGLSGGVMAGGNVAINKVNSSVQNKQQANTPPKTLQEAVQQQISGKLTVEKPVQAGTVELDAPTVRVSDEVWQQSQRLAAATGRKIRLYEGAENVNGSYDTESGTIWVNTKGGDVLTQVFSHEMTHSLEEAGAYGKLSEIVLSRMQATGIDLDVAREAKRKQYERQGHALQTAAEVDQELVAEYVSKYLLTDEASIVSLVKQDRTLGQRIMDWFDSILAKLGNKNAQERAFLSKARDLYVKALRQTQGVGTAQAQQAQQQTAAAPMGEQGTTESAVESTDDYVETLNALLAAGEITDDQYDTAMDEYEQWQEEQRTAGERKYSFKGYADDGRGIYESNFPRGTPKKAKGERILKYIQDVWSKKPITLRITDGGTTRYIEAQFDPTYSEDKNVRTDASKLMGGNRHGNATEQRVTLDLADDYYQIASESEYNYSKDESGKNSVPHQGVKQWHYFVNDIYFAEQGSEELVPYRVSINVKEKGDGHYFYSFSAEKTEGTPTQRTLHAAVNDSENATANGSSSTSIIHPDAEKVNKKFALGEDAVSKKDVARDLQAILQRGGDVQELKQYVAQLERSGGKAEQKGTSVEQTRSEAEQIVRKAKQQGISVEQYLQENAELYDVDGTWNEDARKALEMEKKGSGRKWSLSDVGGLEVELRQLMDQRERLLMENTAYAQAVEDNRYANTFKERVESTKRMREAAALVNTRDLDERIQAMRDTIANARNAERNEHRADQEKYSGTKTRGYSELNDTRTKALDQEYLRAVGEGDIKKAENLMLEAAEIAMPDSVVRDMSGKLMKVYHYTNGNFTSFDRSFARTGNEMDGFFFAPDPVSTAEYGSNRIAAFLNITNLAMDPALDRKFDDSGTLLREKLAYQGYDGVARTEDGEIYEYMAFDPEQIKSADVIVYDDNGRIIPLSERFNFARNDIRYSLSDDGEVADGEEKPDIRSSMPKKAKDYLKRVERELLWTVADKLSVPKLAGREYLQPIIQEMSDEYLKEGTISQETKDLLFEKAYAQGVIVDAEFYDAYKHIKEHLRNLSVTISDRDKADIADFKDFRRLAFGTLRIVNEGGLPVDTAYQELHSMAPELFPESITHPADQLVRMYDAARSIQVTEKTVQDYYGEYEPEYRRWAKADFEEAVSAASQELWTVKRYADEKIAKDAEKAPATEAEAAEAYKQLKAARRTYERAAAKNLLSEHDQMQVGRLLRHEIELEHLDPEKDNVKGITAVFEAKQEYERLCKLITEYKQHLRGEARKRADGYLQTANDWKDKKVGIAYSRETMERNIFDIVKDKALAQRIVDQYFTPVHKGEAEATRFKSDYRDRVRALELSRKVDKGNLVSEAHAVQLLGEAEDNIRMLENVRGRIKNRDGKNLSEWQAVIQKLWDENPNLDQEKIKRAVKEFRYIYDALFQKMNQVRVANGYEPVNYRNGYFPHFQPGDSDSILAQFGRALGIDTRIDALPTTINGLTHTFKPGIQWFGNAQERLGFNTAYDAVEGFDKYIEGVASVIHQTANIQNLRALASQIRYRTSDDGIREQVDAIQERAGLSEEEKQQLIQEIYAHGKFTLSNFVTELDEYTNLLANKKSRYDRSIEAAIGRKAYTFLKAWEARVGANMIAGNLTSALTNFIPLTQAGAQMDRFALLKGMFGTLQSYRSDDGIVNQSTFLTNRRGSDPLVQTWAQKASDKLGKPMELIDWFVAGSIVRGAYQQNLKRGMSEVEAMSQADAFAASVMADRSKGAMPTLMQASNPLFKAFTQFQLEVNNQFSEVFKDIPRRFKEKGLATLAWVLLKYFLGAWIYNALYEELIGRRPALDPIGMLCQGYDDLQNDGFGTAGANLAVNALEQLPFSSGLTLIGVELDGGRLPASSAVPDLTALWDAATTEGWSAEKRWKEVQDELNKLAYVVTPFGGNQVSKFVKGVKAYAKGGSYNVDAEGNDTLQYPVYKDDPQDAFWSLVKAAFLGKNSLDTAQEWVDSGFDGLNAEQTATYQKLLKLGAADRTAFDAVTQLKNAGSKDMDKLQVIPGLALTDEEKSVLVGSVLGTELLTESGGLTQYAKFDYAIQNGMSVDQYIEYRASGADMDKYLELRDAGAAVEGAMSAGMALAELKEQVEDPTTVQKWRVVIDSTDDAEKQLISLSAVMTGSQYAKVKAAYGFGVSPEIYVEVNELLPKYDADGNGRYTQAEVTKAIGSMNAKSSVKAVLWQLITGSGSAKNNPYSQAIGQKVIDAWEKAKAESEAEGLSFQEEIMRQIMGG